MTHTKLSGMSPGRKRRSAKLITTARSRSQKIWAMAQLSNQAQIVVAIGAPIATAICHGAGAAVPVRRGIIVKRNPTAKQARNPWTCAIEWKIDRYSWVMPSAKRSQCSTPVHASTTPSGKSTRYGSRRQSGALPTDEAIASDGVRIGEREYTGMHLPQPHPRILADS